MWSVRSNLSLPLLLPPTVTMSGSFAWAAVCHRLLWHGLPHGLQGNPSLGTWSISSHHSFLTVRSTGPVLTLFFSACMELCHLLNTYSLRCCHLDIVPCGGTIGGGCVWHGAALASPQRSLQPAPLLSPHHGHSVQWIPARRPFLRGRARRKSWVVDPSCLPKAICENRQRRFFFLCGVQNYMDFLSLEILFAGWWTIIQLQRGVLCVKAGPWWRACLTVASSRSHCPPPIAPSGTCGQVLSTQWWPVEGWCWKGFLRSEALEQEEYFKGKEGRRLVGLRLFEFPEAVWDVGSTQGDRLGQGWGNGLASMAGTGPGECLSSPALGGGDGCGVLQPPVTVTVMFSSAAVQGWSCDAHATWASYWSFRFADSWSFVNSYQYEPNS